jgi:hypothetical protein
MDNPMDHKIIPFHPGHLTLIEPLENDHVSKLENWRGIMAAVAEDNPSYTFVAEGRVVACGGIIKTVIPGVAGAWILPSVYVKAYGLPFAKTVSKVLDDLMEQFKLYRIETSCNMGEPFDEWMKFLGFQSEGVKVKAGAGKNDLMMWAKLREEA